MDGSSPRSDRTHASELVVRDVFNATVNAFAFGLLVVQLGPLAVLALSGARLLAAAVTVGCVLAVIVICCGMRTRVRYDRGQLSVVQTWLFIPWRTLRFDPGSVRVEVIGTGDWGFPGSWPIAELCELTGRVDGRVENVYVGSHAARFEITETIRSWLEPT